MIEQLKKLFCWHKDTKLYYKTRYMKITKCNCCSKWFIDYKRKYISMSDPVIIKGDITLDEVIQCYVHEEKEKLFDDLSHSKMYYHDEDQQKPNASIRRSKEEIERRTKNDKLYYDAVNIFILNNNKH